MYYTNYFYFNLMTLPFLSMLTSKCKSTLLTNNVIQNENWSLHMCGSNNRNKISNHLFVVKILCMISVTHMHIYTYTKEIDVDFF